MKRESVLAALNKGSTVCCESSRWHVGVHTQAGVVRAVYKFDVFTGEKSIDVDFNKCFIHVGGVGSDD